MFAYRVKNANDQSFATLNRLEKQINDQGFDCRRATKDDIKRILSRYFGHMTEDAIDDVDGEIVLSEVAADLNTYEGNVWTMIVSLRREDAERLGYNNARAWQMLLRSHTQELADALRIPLEDLMVRCFS